MEVAVHMTLGLSENMCFQMVLEEYRHWSRYPFFESRVFTACSSAAPEEGLLMEQPLSAS